ncbi:MAG: dienelactone hydrolase family protein [Candidatus Acidiferrales bacterium]
MANIVQQKITLRISDGTSMNAFVARPGGKDKSPGVLVFQEAFGVNAHIRDVTQRIAKEGYVAIAPEMFHRTAPPGFEAGYTDMQSVMPHLRALTETGMSDDIGAAHDWLRKDSQVAADRIASIGFCMGGRVSFLACATVELCAAISFYGGGIAPALLPHASELRAPMLFFWGGRDKHIGQDQIRSVMEALDKERKTYTNVEISDADHGFFCDQRASYNPSAARQAWALSRSFLEMHLKPDVAAAPAAEG